MKPDRDIIYVYDDTFDGFLTCVFEAFVKKEHPSLISKPGGVQLAIGAEVRDIRTDAGKAERVYDGIRAKVGGKALRMIYCVTLSAEPDAEVAALSYIRLLFKVGKRVYGDLTDERVWRVERIAAAVEKERVRYMEFLRFSELEGGILFGEFEPKPNVLPLIMPHFADRLNAQPFIIHDKGRRLAAVYDTNEWCMISSVDMELPRYSENECEYRSLWKLFYNTIAIKERISERRRMGHMPKKYWSFMTEMK